MPTLRKKIELSAPQMAFRRSNAWVRGAMGGINSGKSWIGAYDLIRRAKPGRMYMVLAPNYRMLRHATWRTLKKIARELHFFAGENKTERLLTLGNGAEILGVSADDPDTLRGPNISGAWLDEASLMLELTFDIMIGRIREEGEAGWISLTYTPRGKKHWSYRVLELEESERFLMPTESNPFASRTWLDRLKGRYAPQWARQELGGEAIEVEGTEFSAAWFDDHAWFDDWPTNLIIKTMALDPSKGKKDRVGDFSAYAKVGVGADDVIYVQGFLERMPVDRLVDTGVALWQEFQPDVFGIESNSWQDLLAGSFADGFSRAGLLAPPVKLINNSIDKRIRIRRLGGWIAGGRMKFKRNCPGTKILVEQLEDFPEGVHDDGPDALEMGVRLAQELAGMPVGGTV